MKVIKANETSYPISGRGALKSQDMEGSEEEQEEQELITSKPLLKQEKAATATEPPKAISRTLTEIIQSEDESEEDKPKVFGASLEEEKEPVRTTVGAAAAAAEERNEFIEFSEPEEDLSIDFSQREPDQFSLSAVYYNHKKSKPLICDSLNSCATR